MGEHKPYWVLKNDVKYYTRIHKSECGHCNNGDGPRPDHTGNWHGFTSFREANVWARGIGWTVYNCRRCTPEAA